MVDNILDCSKINLRVGSTGKNVETLQRILKEKKYYNGKIDGLFGELTEKGVKQLQKAQGNTPDGWFGPKTCKKLNNNTGGKTNKQLIEDGKAVPVLEKISGQKITDYKTLYNACKKGVYILYYNDIYTFKQELERVLNKKGLNCTDWAQLVMHGLKEIGFNEKYIRIVRGVVICKSGKAYGHVWLQLYINGKWVNYDPSAAAAHGYNIGSLICNKDYKVTNINPGWAVSDDGRT